MANEITLSELLRQEAVLTFPAFDNEVAIALGSLALAVARERALPVAINVTRNRQQLFHAALPGTTLDNDHWIARKSAVVYRFGHSSFYMGQSTVPGGPSFHERHMVDAKDYAAHGGSFPISVEGTGLVGAITVSGLPQQADHELVVEILARFLSERFGKTGL